MKRVLITGKNSFIGSNFRKYSAQSEIHEVSLFETSPENIDFKGFDVVLHVAALVHISSSVPESEYMKINRDLAVSVAENAKRSGVRQFIFMSTLKVFGDSIKQNEIVDESTVCLPADSYSKSKYEAELAISSLLDENFAVSIVRTPLVYGEGVKANMFNLIRLVDRVRVLPFGGINNKRDFTFVRNLIAYLDKIIDKGFSGTFITKDAESLSTTELVRLISMILEKRTMLFTLPVFIKAVLLKTLPSYYDRLFGSYSVSNARTNEVLQFSPPFSTEDGMRFTIQYYLSLFKK
jgi:nucleoside-diphosphate-sugar epimerase